MEKKPLIGVSLCAVVLLVLGSLSHVVGYQTVENSQQNLVKERINQRELLLQIIVDISNDKGIQKIILKSQISREIVPIKNIPVLTKKYLKQMYFVGLILLKFISMSRGQLVMQHQNQIINPEARQEISTAIENNPMLKSKITQLQQSNCDCDNENLLHWNFPLICKILLFFGEIGFILIFFQGVHILGMIIVSIILPLLKIFNCM